jgi:hypothetical protein
MGIEDAINRIGSEEQEDAQVFVGVGAGDGEVLGIHASILPRGSDIRGHTGSIIAKMRETLDTAEEFPDATA